MHVRRHWVTLFTVCLLLVAGCSSARFGYSLAPSWLSWRIDRDLALDDAQRALVRERLDALHRWHRENELPRYATLLDEIARAATPAQRVTGPQGAEAAPATEGPTPAQIAAWRAALTEAWERLAVRVAPDVAALALTLKPGQLERLAERFEARNDELREEWGLSGNPAGPAAASALLEARVERFRGRAEFFFGDLAPRQTALLRELAAGHPPYEADWMRERQARQRAAIEVLSRIASTQPPRQEAERQVREWLLSVLEVSEPQRAARLAESAAASDRLALALLQAASPQQLATMKSRLEGWSQDLAMLTTR